jgi:cystathionine beta-lyase
MDYASPEPVIAAMRELVERGNFGYAEEPPLLREVLIHYLDRHFGWRVEPEWIVHLPGLVPGLNVACRMLPRDAAVLTHTPVYPPFLTAPGNQGQVLQAVDMVRVDGRWELDIEALEMSITPRTKLFMLCNPHNPTGRVFSQEELHAIHDLALRHDLMVCSDEIHCDLVLEPELKHCPYAALNPEAANHSITLMAPSKTFNLPGLGYSFAVISNPLLRRHFQQVMAGIVPHPGLPAFVAAEVAYREGWAWLQEALAYLKQNRDLAYERLSRYPQWRITLPQATYLMWITIDRLDRDHPASWFESFGVGLSDGAPFGDGRSVRLNFACSRSVLEEALDRIDRAMTLC